ncbi:hypothetical protein KOW79_001617 [Hemibagrus wyckioides]|uniref:Ig-like domain-containing protein n=2 Tax=Hemibagrus wyckioides TaxID=337641 RepID=A0A9D3P5L9_9TELE|nr:hypothetical protein KOW79_001617 [Hemibagrus wyckioides]
MILYVFVYIILILIFSPGLSVSMCTLKVTQPQEILHGRFNQSVYIPCHVNMSCHLKIAEEVQWYVFTTKSYHQLDINNHPMRYRLEGRGLHISLLSHNDDGVYYCAASYKDLANSGAQDIGSGTTLTVKDNDYSTGQVLLLTLVVLLSLYSLIILTLFICVKTGRIKLLKGRQSQSQGKGDSTRRVHFGAVVQELYSKRNLRRNKKNSSTEVAQENKVENPRPNKRREDIYQNLKRAR